MRAVSDSIVYYGVMATASYQMGQSSMKQDRLHTHTPAWMHHITHAVSHCAAWLRKKERMQGSRMLQKLLENPRKGVEKKAIHSSEIISEFSHSSARINDRQHYLRALLLQGWSAGSSTDHFDLTKNGTTLTIATEQSRNPLTRHWFRATDLTDISELRAWIIALDSAE
jgi:hypothetical protein